MDKNDFIKQEKQEPIPEIYYKLMECLYDTQRELFERKEKLGEPIVFGNAKGMWIASAKEALDTLRIRRQEFQNFWKNRKNF